MPLPFVKLQAAGNGYILVDGRDDERDWPKLAKAMGEHRLGVGSDGLAVAQRSHVADIRMRIFNTDGSESEMSGNGIRLFAKFVLDRGIAQTTDGALHVETGGGLRAVYPVYEGGEASGMSAARVVMGTPEFRSAHIPVVAPGLDANGRVFDWPLELEDRTILITCLAIGNPHAVALLDESVVDFPLDVIGPLVMSHPFFPNRINFEIVNRLGDGKIRARIFERGEGETQASGTGSTAAAIAAHLHGWVGDRVEVVLPGGDLRIEWAGRGEAVLEGPAVEVFSGVWPD